MYGPPPSEAPANLEPARLGIGTTLWRIDADPAESWTWTGSSSPRARFDPASGAFRTRYAATTATGAARERYTAVGRYIPADHGRHHLVELTARRPLSVLDLRSEKTLDALGADDRVSTSHDPMVWDFCQALIEVARTWWANLDGILYRSRTTPESSANLAFFSAEAFAVASRPLVECRELVDDLILQHHFAVDFEM